VQTREIPFLRLCLPLCTGVLVAECLPHMPVVAGVIFILALTLMTIRLLHTGYHSDNLFGAAIFLFLVATGYLLRTGERTRPCELAGARQEITLRLSEYPEKSNSGCSLKARLISMGESDSLIRLRGSMLLWFITDTIPPGWKPGDILRLNIKPVSIRNNGNPCEFNYSRWLEGRGIKQMAFFRPSDITGYLAGERHSLRESSLIAARRMTDLLRKSGLQGDELGLIIALTIGDKEYLEKEQLTSFSRAGAMHIMAVSGLHVGMISMALSWFLFFLRGKLKRVRVLIIVPALWAFAFITGMSPSVLRATIMFTFLQAGSLMHRPAAGMNSLLASAFILITMHPGVIFEAGFQLSYLAVGFIITFYSDIYRLIRIKNRILNYLWQITALSMVAQAGTMALSIRLFNIFPLLFPVANIVIIPITFLIVLMAILLLLTSFLPPVSSLIALLLDRLAAFTLNYTGIISSAQHGVITNIGMSSTETIMLTLTMALLLATLLHHKKLTLRPLLVAVVLLLTCNTVKTAGERQQNRIVTYNIRGKKLAVRQFGRVLLVPSVDGKIPVEVQKHAFTRGLKIVTVEPG